MNAMTDALLVTQNFCTIAEDKGLGTCFLGTTIYNPHQIIEILNLPELVIPVATITVGYPDESPAQPDRLPIKGIIHQEKYHDYTPEEIEDILLIRNLFLKPSFVEINHTEIPCPDFTDIQI